MRRPRHSSPGHVGGYSPKHPPGDLELLRGTPARVHGMLEQIRPNLVLSSLGNFSE